MATILGRFDTRLVAGLHSHRKPGNASHAVGGAPVGTPGRTALVDYFRLRDPGRCADFTDSVRDAQAFLEIRFGIRSGDRIEQQYCGMTTRL
jgi:hypothetical protein